MSLTIIIIGITILFILLAAAFSSRFILLMIYLAELLNLGHLFDFQSKSSLDKIFYSYRHNNIKAWTQWLSKQPDSTKDEALVLLLEHLGGDPGNWGLMSPQAVRAIEIFLHEDDEADSDETDNLEELIAELQNINDNCKKYWLKFKVTKKMHQACWETIIQLDYQKALELFKQELNSVELSDSELLVSMVNSLKAFKQEIDISDLLSEMLTHSKLAYEAKKQCLTLMEEYREEEENKETTIKTLKNLIKYRTPMDADDLGKVLLRLLNLSIDENISDNIINAIVQLCEDETYGQACIQALGKLIQRDPNLFSPEVLYCFVSSKHPNINQLIKVLAKVFALNTAETELCLSNDHGLDSFQVNLLAYEKIDEFAVIPTMKDYLEAIKSSVKSAQSIELTLISGNSEKDKLYLARAIAADLQYSFLYASYIDLQGSEIVINDLEEKVQQHKPLLIYISEIDSLFETMNNSFVNKVKKFALDPQIKIVLTCNHDAGSFEIPRELSTMLNRQAIQVPALI
ncbi:MAG: hypothetical protein OXU45_01420, partial [Candidatus Melainabacteria bacterium]|nr:hypothetical protein [Candidatus Melainabacteria bacterium]